ncbi:MAG: TetR/AcrR family transcriptional regulator [Prevotella sp.]|nr:TetR/AcrR family transcriptional regulator [Prevotella sp.]
MKSVTSYRQELKERILTLSLKEFKSKGIKAVKMDDLAKQLSISKRTLYEIYANKEELLKAGVAYQNDSFDARMKCYAETHPYNVMDTIVEFYRIQVLENADVNPLFFSEIHKYPSVISMLKERHYLREQESQAFFERGIKEGYFRSDLNYSLVIYFGRMMRENVMQEKIYQKYPMKLIFQNFLFVFIRGLCTQRGIDILDQLIAETDPTLG